MRILMLSGGHRYRPNQAINVGDVAQLLHAKQLVQSLWPNVHCVLVAHSPNDESPVEGLDYSRILIDFVVGTSARSMVLRPISYLLRLCGLWFRAQWPRAARVIVGEDRLAERVLKEIGSAQLVLVTGAGVLSDNYSMGTAYLWSAYIQIASALGVPVVLLGQQIGPLRGALTRLVVGAALRKARFVGVRDPHSKHIVRRLGVEEARVMLTGDEGLYLKPADSNLTERHLAMAGITGAYIAVHFRVDRNCPFERLKARFAEAVDCIAGELTAGVVFVPMSYAAADDDRDACRAVMQLMSTRAVLIDVAGDACLTKSLIEGAALAIGFANHFCVFAAGAGVPTVALFGTEYMEQKMRGLQGLHRCVRALRFTEEISIDELSDATLIHQRECAESANSRTQIQKPNGYLDWVSALESK